MLMFSGNSSTCLYQKFRCAVGIMCALAMSGLVCRSNNHSINEVTSSRQRRRQDQQDEGSGPQNSSGKHYNEIGRQVTTVPSFVTVPRANT
jgi:hypothetical protein